MAETMFGMPVQVSSNRALISRTAWGRPVFAADCLDSKGADISSQPEVFTSLIENAESCNEAVKMAEACAWGSSLDVFTAGTAYTVCDKELQKEKPTEVVSALLNSMMNTCNDKYENEEGTMYRSFNAYCHLSAVEWILDIATPN